MFQVEIFWVVTSCSIVVRCQRFKGPCCPHLQGHGVTTHKTTTWNTYWSSLTGVIQRGVSESSLNTEYKDQKSDLCDRPKFNVFW